MTEQAWKGSKRWSCDKCGRTYSTPIRAFKVSCPDCPNPLGRKTIWMKPEEV